MSLTGMMIILRLMIPTIWIDFFWHSGLSGAIISMISFVATGVIIYLFLKIFRVKGYSFTQAKRSLLYWLLLPWMMIYALISIPMALLFSLGDLAEEPNNYLVIVEKA